MRDEGQGISQAALQLFSRLSNLKKQASEIVSRLHNANNPISVTISALDLVADPNHLPAIPKPNCRSARLHHQ